MRKEFCSYTQINIRQNIAFTSQMLTVLNYNS